MFTATARNLGYRFFKKYPYLVSYNRVPWNLIEAGSEQAHRVAAPLYRRLLLAAAAGPMPTLVASGHPVVPRELQLQHLPGLYYVVPQSAAQLADITAADAAVAASDADAAEASAVAGSIPWAPFGWAGGATRDPMALSHYGPLHRDVAAVRGVYEFRSPDLRMLCTAVVLGPLRTPTGSANAALHKAGAKLATSGAEATGAAGYVLFHFYRPNRTPKELAAPFRHLKDAVAPESGVLSALASGAWTPRLTRPATLAAGARKTASPMPAISVPSSSPYGLPERDGLRPGDAFGCRSRMWGHWL
jgi:hypothetical protein